MLQGNVSWLQIQNHALNKTGFHRPNNTQLHIGEPTTLSLRKKGKKLPTLIKRPQTEHDIFWGGGGVGVFF